ncbi:MAG: DMT family transporter [Chloroflexi bacterium]|nr:DMT family transporter [Chloroflexota bacterium]MCI0575693.1 DMT family transporter [Chloroflexota bacterium]MCI0648035.1 DMT family transporter [Chloroflexota bacterium]MCI0726479.1 DMT family transporter [Chloroflexota bacterium]
MKLKEWGAFWLLGLIWGSSFLWIKIAVAELGPFTLVAFRLLFGLAGLVAVLRWRPQPFPRDRHTLLAYLFMGVFQTALPFTLISWGETRIEAGLTSILNGTVPLFVIIIAHFWLQDEKMTIARVAGLVVGFSGVVVLVGRDLGSQGMQGNLWGQLAVLAGSISYAAAATFARRYLRGQSPVVQSTMVLGVAGGLMWLAAPVVERPFTWPALPITWVAVAWLGLLSSCLAYLLYFYLINAWGATRASVVTYVFPVIGLILGVIFLGEVADWWLLAGSLLVVAGIAVVNLEPRLAARLAARRGWPNTSPLRNREDPT